jgi:Calcineurin-like phosphoesterase
MGGPLDRVALRATLSSMPPLTWPRRAAPLTTLLLLLALFAAACSDDGAGPTPDAAPLADGAGDALASDGPAADLPRADAPLPDVPLPDAPLPDAPCPDPGVDLGSGVTIRPTNLTPGGQATVTYAASATLGSSANLTLHYGGDFWTGDLGGGDKAKDVAMTKQADGSFSVTITLPAAARLLDLVFFTTQGSAKTWDNNNKADWHRALGEPLYGPYLTLKDNSAAPGKQDRDPAHSVTVNFRSDRPCRGRVRFGTAAAALSAAITESGAGVDHHLHIGGQLKPDTRYHYQVACHDPAVNCKTEERSAVYSFRTAPAAGSSGSANLKLIVLADPQDNMLAQDRWRDVAAALTKPPHADARLLLIVGDLAGDDTPVRWWTFFHHGRALLASRVLLPVVGNHDTPTYGSHVDSTTFEQLFSLGSSSGQDTHWALRYGPAAFIALNSETAQSWVSTTDWTPGGKQRTWLQGALTKLPAAATWRFATWHIPPYNVGVTHVDQNASTRGVTTLFGGVIDWVLGGHEHLYQRSKPLQSVSGSGGQVSGKVVANYGRGPGDGVGYLIAPAAGHDPPEDTLVKASDPLRGGLAYPTAAEISGKDTITPWVGFVTLELKAKSMSLRAYELGVAAPRDTLTYTKP